MRAPNMRGGAEPKYGTFPSHSPTAINCKENQPVAPVSENYNCPRNSINTYLKRSMLLPPSSIPEQSIPPVRLEALRAHHGGISISNAIHNAVDLRRFVSLSLVTKPVPHWASRRTLKPIRVVERAYLQLSNWLAR